MARDLTLPPAPSYLQNYYPEGSALNKDLTDHVGESFPVLSIRSGKFFIRFQGVEKPYLDASGRYQSPTIDVVILKSNPVLTKTWYARGYQSGDREAPDCFSTDGKAPDADAPNTPIDPRTGQRMQFCSVCPNNIFGSAPKNSEGQGGRGKACSDGRRIAVLIPPHALDGEIIPVLMRIPPTSLRPLAEYGALLERARYPYHAIRTRLSFATVDSKGNPIGYPVLKFEDISALPEDEFAFVDKLRREPIINRMLQSKVDGVTADVPRPELTSRFEQQAEEYASLGAPVMNDVVAPSAPAPTEPGVVGKLSDGRLVMADGTFRDPAPPPPPAKPEPTVVGVLADGRTVMSDGTFREPEKPKVDKTGWVKLQDMEGVYYSPQRGYLVDENGDQWTAVKPGILMSPEEKEQAGLPPSRVVPLRQEVLPPEPKDKPTAEQARSRSRVARPRSVKENPEEAKPEAQEAQADEAPKPNGSAADRVVAPATPGLDQVLASIKPSGVVKE